MHQGYRRAYGAPQVHQALRQQGLSCSRRRVNR
ncbi:IS3 family transposase [Marinobacter sp. AC-23]